MKRLLCALLASGLFALAAVAGDDALGVGLERATGTTGSGA